MMQMNCNIYDLCTGAKSNQIKSNQTQLLNNIEGSIEICLYFYVSWYDHAKCHDHLILKLLLLFYIILALTEL